MNKPQLPLASGELDMAAGVRIVAKQHRRRGSPPRLPPRLCPPHVDDPAPEPGAPEGPSTPPTPPSFLRWKQYPVLAASCVLCVLGFYLHMLPFSASGRGCSEQRRRQQRSGRSRISGWRCPEGGESSPLLGFTMAFMLLFSIVIALFKDVPDTKGDLKAGPPGYQPR